MKQRECGSTGLIRLHHPGFVFALLFLGVGAACSQVEEPTTEAISHWRRRCVQRAVQSADAKPGLAGGGGHAFHRCAFPFCRLHADSLRAADRALLLEEPLEAGRAEGLLAVAD